MASTSKQLVCAFAAIVTVAIGGVACGEAQPADADAAAADSPPPPPPPLEDATPGDEDATPGDTALSALTISDGDLDAPFSPDITRYGATTSATIRNYFRPPPATMRRRSA